MSESNRSGVSFLSEKFEIELIFKIYNSAYHSALTGLSDTRDLKTLVGSYFFDPKIFSRIFCLSSIVSVAGKS